MVFGLEMAPGSCHYDTILRNRPARATRVAMQRGAQPRQVKAALTRVLRSAGIALDATAVASLAEGLDENVPHLSDPVGQSRAAAESG